MYENVYQGWINGMSNGDMREQELWSEYRISRDKYLLQYVYQFRESIKYVIFRNYARVEVICTENIPYLLKLLPWEYLIGPLQQVTTVASVYSIDVPAALQQEGETDDKT